MNRKQVEFTLHMLRKIRREKMRFAKTYNLRINKNGDVNGNSWDGFLNSHNEIKSYYKRLVNIEQKSFDFTHEDYFKVPEEQRRGF